MLRDQMAGYFTSETPPYITSHNDARNLILKIDRDELPRRFEVLSVSQISRFTLDEKMGLEMSVKDYRCCCMIYSGYYSNRESLQLSGRY